MFSVNEITQFLEFGKQILFQINALIDKVVTGLDYIESKLVIDRYMDKVERKLEQ